MNIKRYIVIVLFTCVCFINNCDSDNNFLDITKTAAGNISKQWPKILGGSNYEHSASIQQTSDGGYIIAGWTQSNDCDVTGNHGYNDWWVVKLDAQGNKQWAKCFGGTNDDGATCIQQTGDGGYIVVGYTKSNDGDVSGNHGDYDCWVIKLDAQGNKQWAKCFGGTSEDRATSIQQTSDSGYIVTGYTFSSNGDVTDYHGGNGSDYWIIKLDLNGDKEWAKCFGGTYYDNAYSIQQTSDGGYIIAGYTLSSDGDVTNYHGGEDCFIVKLNSNGNKVWAKCFGGTSNDGATSIQQTNDGGFIVAGYTASNDGDIKGDNHGLYDYWTIKLDNSGAIQWTKCFGGTKEDSATSIQQTIDGGYIVFGLVWSNDCDVIGYYGEGDWWIVKIDTNGNLKR